VSDRRRRRIAAVLVLPVWVSILALAAIGAPSASAATVTTGNSCTNNAQAGTTSLPITLSGVASPATAVSGDTITLDGATFAIDVPGTVLVTGYRLGLLSAGAVSIPASVNLTLLGANTDEGSATLPPLSVTGATTITDPTPANKNSGDETATPLAVTAALPTTTWTASGTGDVTIRLGDSSTTALVGPGGVISVTFTCTPGSPTPAGCGAAPLAACTGTDPVPAVPFTSVAVGDGSSTSSSSTSSSSSSSTTSSSTTTSSTTTSSTTTSSTSSTSTTAPPVVPTTVSGTGTYATTCSNSVTPDLSELQFTAAGSTISPVEAGSTVSLTDQSWEVTVPGSVLQTGINLGLLKAGDSPAGTAEVSVFASNTKEGDVTSPPIPLSVGPIVVEGGQAQPAKTAFSAPDMSWTAVGGDVVFAMSGAKVKVAIGPLEVTFTCAPADPSVAIVTAAVRGSTGIPPAKPGVQVLGATTRNAPAAQDLPRTGTNPLVPAAVAVGLIDIGYLLVSVARSARPRLRYLR